MSGMFGGGSDSGVAGGLPNGVKLAAIALLAHQLMKHAQTGQDPANAGPAGAPAGGGLGGLLGGLLGGGGAASGGGAAASGGLGGALGGLLGGGALGGLGGLLSSLRSHGLGPNVDSWVGPGENQPVAPKDLERTFDPKDLDEAARQAGTDRGSVLSELSNMLPGAVDKMTPGGRVPERGAAGPAGGGLQDLLSHLLGGGRS